MDKMKRVSIMQLSGREFDCRSRCLHFNPGCPVILLFPFNITAVEIVPFFLPQKHKINYNTMKGLITFFRVQLLGRPFDCRLQGPRLKNGCTHCFYCS